MQIVKYGVGEMQANCYLLIKNNLCILVDPGDSAEFILEEIQRRNLQLIGIFATHGHIDHIMAVGEIQTSFSVPLYIHKDDIFLVSRLASTAKHFLKGNPLVISPKEIQHIHTGQFIIQDFLFEIISSPGHTPGSCCFYFRDDQVLFTGDTLFKEGIGRYDFKYSSKNQLKSSLELLFTLNGIINVYPGHGENTLLHLQKESALKLF